MACRDGDSPSRRAILHRPGQNVKISGTNIFVPKFWKIGHNSELARWNLLSVVAFQAKTPRIEILQARGLGKFCSSRTSPVKVGVVHQIFGVDTCKLTLVQNFSALPGAQHLERCFAHAYVSHMACRDGDSPFSRAIL